MSDPRMPQPWDMIGHDHYHALDQVLGKERARRVFFDVAQEFGCAYCGAVPGQPCTIEGTTRETYGYVHKSRREQSSSEARKRIWDLTNHIVEARIRGERATAPVSLPSAVELPRPRIQLRAKLPGWRDPDADVPLGVRLGLAVEKARAARERSERAWREMADSEACLLEAERELREMAARVGIEDPETLLKTADVAAEATQ